MNWMTWMENWDVLTVIGAVLVVGGIHLSANYVLKVAERMKRKRRRRRR